MITLSYNKDEDQFVFHRIPSKSKTYKELQKKLSEFNEYSFLLQNGKVFCEFADEDKDKKSLIIYHAQDILKSFSKIKFIANIDFLTHIKILQDELNIVEINEKDKDFIQQKINETTKNAFIYNCRQIEIFLCTELLFIVKNSKNNEFTELYKGKTKVVRLKKEYEEDIFMTIGYGLIMISFTAFAIDLLNCLALLSGLKITIAMMITVASTTPIGCITSGIALVAMLAAVIIFLVKNFNNKKEITAAQRIEDKINNDFATTEPVGMASSCTM